MAAAERELNELQESLAAIELRELKESLEAIEAMERSELEAVLELQALLEVQELVDRDAAAEENRLAAIEIQERMYAEELLEQLANHGSTPPSAIASTPGEGDGSSTAAGSESEAEDLSQEHCMCPITHDTMTDPVMLVGDGHTYERHAIEDWLAEKSTSPISNVALTAEGRKLVPNYHARALVEAWSSRNQ